MAMPFSENTQKPNTNIEYRMLTEKEKKYLADLGKQMEEQLIKAALRKALNGK